MPYDRARVLKNCTDSFLLSAELLKKEVEKNPSTLAIRLAVNAAFAAELSMKRYIELTTSTPVKGHRLRELWDQIDANVKGQVIPQVC